ncbi:MAG: type IV toxin-antitoxin system AbiEi family antitoxin domain-containing protein [Thermoplasmata archaeon]|nr:MAG: type IV toxin-antitoxin system AbiEi family antitoxin domain-containing protein [Thermoplasmata archaeon]
MRYTGMSAREMRLLDLVETNGLVVFTTSDARRLLEVGRPDVHRILSRMTSKGHLVRLERGKYIDARSARELDVYEVVPHVVEPSYLSLWSGLHLHGLSTQVPRVIFVIVTTPRRGLKVLGSPVRFVSVRPRLFFGYERRGDHVVADVEKLLLDCLMFPHYCGGWDEIFRSFGNAELDPELVVEYAIMTGSPSLCSRLGYTLERLGVEFDVERLEKASYHGRIVLDPSRPKGDGEGVTRWNVEVNVEGGP